MKIFVTHSSSFDFKEELYKPLRSSSLNDKHDITLPHEDGRQIDTKNIIKNQQLLIAEISYPSTGSGIELGWASAFGVPIIGIYKSGLAPSSSVSYITKDQIEYKDAEDLISKLSNYLQSLA